jgi:hypothetical protein
MWREPDPRRTLATLRARHQAYRVARQMLHPPMEPYQFFCRQCGARLDVAQLDPHDQIRCEDCGLPTRLPPAAAADLRRWLARAGSGARSSPVSFAALVLWTYFLIALLIVFAAL